MARARITITYEYDIGPLGHYPGCKSVAECAAFDLRAFREDRTSLFDLMLDEHIEINGNLLPST